ncbi:hypothetical protein BH11MYX1_BH11MYX1_37620 [soil metagenome]
MKWLVILVVSLGCQQKKKEPEPTPLPPPVVVAAADGGPTASIDLFAAMPSTVIVSSRVANHTIKPEHIADRDLETAWSSATDDLLGAWIDVEVPNATVRELRMTIGHTGHGPSGEDYFTMNPRIREVAVVAGARSMSFELDITKRELQTLALQATGRIRIIVTGVEPGSKRAWREIAISELEAWGTPPASWKAPANALKPDVSVYEPPAPDPLDPCNGADAAREAFIKQHAHDTYSGNGGEDHAGYPPRCDHVELPLLPEGWDKAGAGCQVQDEIYGPKTCIVQFERAGQRASIEVVSEFQSAAFSVASVDEVSEVHGVAISLKTSRGDQVAVCRASPIVCTAPRVVATEDWTTTPTFTADALVLEAGTGSPPAGVIGRHQLVFARTAR